MVLGLVGILVAVALSDIKLLGNPQGNAAYSVERFLRLARSTAISTTAAVKVRPTAANKLLAYTGQSCSDSTDTIPGMVLTLPLGSQLDSTAWSVCFDTRGFADANISFGLVAAHGGTKTVRVALGGGTKVDQ